MVTGNTKQITADFYCFNIKGEKDTTLMADFLSEHVQGHATPFHLDDGPKEFHQIRNIQVSKNGKVFKAVFGRCRVGEVPEQASATSDDKDVKLEKDHGLVEKNHFLFFADLNLVVYQRNNSGSKYQRLQKYLARALKQPHAALEPVLTKDSYSKLMEGGSLKKIELSILQPAMSADAGEEFIGEAIDMFKTSGAGAMKITLRADRDKTLEETLRTSFVTLARFGRARIARATLVGDDDGEDEIIDLIADRIKQPIDVKLGANGRATPDEIYAALASAKDIRKDDLRAFFGT